MIKYIFTITILTGVFFTACNNGQNRQSRAIDPMVYESENLMVRKISNHVYAHTSFLNSHDFGRVPCNGMIVVNNNEAIVFDTTCDDESSGELINYIMKKLQCKIKAIIPAHFHEDCVGGLEKFNAYNIPAYASNKTIKLLSMNNKKFSKPITGFDDSLTLRIGDKKVYAQYFGEGHTKDNIIGYFPEDKVMFGGCLIKEEGAEKGNLADANVKEWPETVRKVKEKYPQTKIVIPGHGKLGGTALFDYTIRLFEQKNAI